MASLRVYRDYILDESLAPRRTPSLSHGSNTASSPRASGATSPRTTSSRTTSPRTVIPDLQRTADRRTSSLRENGIGLARTTEDEKTDSIRDFSTGIAHRMENEKPDSLRNYDIANVHRLENQRPDSLREYDLGITHRPESQRPNSGRNHDLGITHGTEHQKPDSLRDRSLSITRQIESERPDSLRDYNIGIAHILGNEKPDSILESGTSTARMSEEDGTVTPHDEEPVEPVLHETQFDLQSLDSAVPAFSTDVHKKRGLAPSLRSTSEFSYSGQAMGRPSVQGRPSNASKLPEFFSLATFQIVLQNPTIAHQLLKFGQSRLCGENLEFLARVTKYCALVSEVSKAIYEIHKDFISTSAPNQINLPEHLLLKTYNDMKAALTSTLPSLESIFTDANSDIERLVYTDIYPNFVRHQMSVSAAKALGGDRAKYAGLGDCFVLTDPAKADNPIVYASDGFVKVTGYLRNEIIPRNCRFLQCRNTDRSAVRRLKASIDKRHEHVELLLNQKKNGEPFWNLLFTAPLYDAHGRLAFFLGGQINCSSTIHNASDVLRILGQSKEADELAVPGTVSPQMVRPTQSRSRTILSAFRSNSRSQIQQRAPGMENVLLDRIEDLPLKNQMDNFYTAYSNYIIINYSSFLIAFASAGVLDLLFPVKAKTSYGALAPAIGSDVFKFLSNHGSGSVSSDYKSMVRRALKMGQPISLDLKLCAKPYMGFETFVLHWTPLKDEVGAVTWIVLTLGNEKRA